MPTLITDPNLESRLRAERHVSGGDRYDEVWEGTYVVSPLADVEHQTIQRRLTTIFEIALGPHPLIFAGLNVSDRELGWEHNYRCPDVAVFLPDTAARLLPTHSLGGPDFAVEILSPGDRARDKIPFYAAVATRELLLIDRNPWSLELYRLDGAALALAARAAPDAPAPAASTVLPLDFRLASGTPRPTIIISHRNGSDGWTI